MHLFMRNYMIVGYNLTKSCPLGQLLFKLKIQKYNINYSFYLAPIHLPMRYEHVY